MFETILKLLFEIFSKKSYTHSKNLSYEYKCHNTSLVKHFDFCFFNNSFIYIKCNFMHRAKTYNQIQI